MSKRRDQRFPVNQRATVHDPEHDIHLQVFVRDISAGGLFVSTDHRFDNGAQLEVELPLASGDRLLLSGEAVHSISREQGAKWGRPFGVGVSFGTLAPTPAAQLEAYLDDVQRRLDDELKPAPFETSLLIQVEHGHRLGDLYAVLGLDPSADGDQIRDALQMRTDVMNGLLAYDGLTEPLRKRVIAARLSVQRAAALLGDVGKRAAYLLRNNLLEPEALAQYLLPLPAVWDEIARTWDGTHAGAAAAGRALGDQARAAAASGDRRAAIARAQAALAQHPFLFGLRQELTDWQRAG